MTNSMIQFIIKKLNTEFQKEISITANKKLMD